MGERGHPCLRPLDDLSKLDGEPLIRTTKFTDSKHLII